MESHSTTRHAVSSDDADKFDNYLCCVVRNTEMKTVNGHTA